jgi:hypothetical protein
MFLTSIGSLTARLGGAHGPAVEVLTATFARLNGKRRNFAPSLQISRIERRFATMSLRVD